MQFHTTGLSTLTGIFDQLQTKPTIEAVNAALPGGYAKQLPLFALTVWNQEPIGSSGWPITEDFNTWDHWSGKPNETPETQVTLNNLVGRVFLLAHPGTDFPALSIGAYDRVAVTDPKVKYLEFTNDLSGKPVHVDAMVQLSDGTWHLQDWTSKKTIDFCRDKADEDVTKVVIVSTNISLHANLSRFAHKLDARATCPYPHRFVGTFHVVSTFNATDPNGTINETETADGTATFVRAPPPNNPPTDVGTIQYQLVSGSVTWTATHTDMNCSSSDGGTFTLDSSSLMTLGYNPQPDPTKPWTYSIQTGPDPAHIPQWNACGTHPYLLVAGMTAGGTVADPTSLTDMQTIGQDPLILTQNWSFTGYTQ
jgi:hypothetical protein